MVIKTKDSINKQLYEAMGQTTMFGHDNLQFKTLFYFSNNLSLFLSNNQSSRTIVIKIIILKV